MRELVEKINAQIASFQSDAHLQIEYGNKAAGTRARKTKLELAKLLKERDNLCFRPSPLAGKFQ